jgi:CDP-diacylglycerol--serine O-phosphatidyltransferase
VIWGIAAFYICCTALRLARFNVETVSHAEEDHRNFRGLPSPGAAGAVASLIILHQHLWVTKFNEVAPPGFGATSSLAIPIVTMFCSAAMVSRLRYAHIINRYLRGKRSFAYVAWIVAPIVLAIWWFQITLAVLFTVYLLSGPVLTIMSRGKPRQGQAPSGMAPGAADPRAQPPAP